MLRVGGQLVSSTWNAFIHIYRLAPFSFGTCFVSLNATFMPLTS